MKTMLVATAALAAAFSLPALGQSQPEIGTRARAILDVDGLQFRDANGNGNLDPYEDWRLPVADRVSDLLERMSIEERAGMLLIDTLNAGCAGTTEGTRAEEMIAEQHMTRFILRNTIAAKAQTCDGRPSRSGFDVTARQMAAFANAVQELAETQPSGIPVLFKDNARNHRESDPRFGIGGGAGAMTAFPKELGIAAAVLGTESMAPVEALTQVTAAEWRALGLRGMYGYMADLATEPRWHRVHETFGEDSDTVADIMEALVLGLQGGPVDSESDVALTMKHFPGGGPQEQGLDPHYSFGQRQVYPSGAFAAHLAPFQRAIDAGLGAIMPYYGVPVDLTHEGETFDEVGFSFSAQTVNGLLRDRLGFQGYVNSDTGIIQSRAWGFADATVPERVALAINSGNDVLSGFSDVGEILDLVEAGLIDEARVTEAAGRLLTEQFALGLFENPYVDEDAAGDIVAAPDHLALAAQVHRESIVLLQNDNLLPLAQGAQIYVLNADAGMAAEAGFKVTQGTADDGRSSAADHDAAVIRVYVRNTGTGDYRSNDPEWGANPEHLNPRTGEVWGGEDNCNVTPDLNASCADDGQIGGPGSPALGLLFGGALPWEADALSFTTMAEAQSWDIFPPLPVIREVMNEVGAQRTIIAIDFRNPYVIDAESGLRDAGALLATFGAVDDALFDVLSGQFAPVGRLPFALPDNLGAVIENASDAPGYAAEDTLFPFAHGLSY
ncbi:glycoside hydrolase family 3 protein [Halomonas sp. GD1P12]|uniref:glycoside hydrolase family 3 protein n=1 Tax=Halomonas sp. GD1P12 TaxID=2982691 RepID=UPI0021E3C318|nr:glycoside hydrolase family 3 N-terminal domain-containing protein [Halomonas sp. GD1P12]UYG00529.1 glycoside hydrolase family 3 protein [Halomonas sp. GD1P12]